MPTHDRRASLERTLRALADQDVPLTRVEVIVVADGCRDGTAEALRTMAGATPFGLRWRAQPQRGPAAARNVALTMARGEVVVFLDDDVAPVRHWLRTHLAYHDGDDRLVVIAPLAPGSPSRPAWVRWEDDSVQQQYVAMLAGTYDPTPRQFYTGNSSVRRRWLLEVGGFDERLQRGEDVELAFRLRDLGLRFRFAPEAEGRHDSFRTYESWRRIPRQYGRNDVRMGTEQGRVELLGAIGAEYHDRRRATRQLARACLGRPVRYRLATDALGLVARAADRLGRYEVSAAACSGVWNLAYWQGVCDALGGRPAFWQLVGRSW